MGFWEFIGDLVLAGLLILLALDLGEIMGKRLRTFLGFERDIF